MAYIRYGNINKMFKGHQQVLESIGKKYEEHSRLKQMTAQNEWDMGELENNFKLAVISSLDSDGKPLHKNEQSRKVAVETLLRGDPEYNRLRVLNDDTNDQLVAVDDELSKLKHQLKFYETWGRS